MAYKPYAPRDPRTLHAALSDAIDQLGGRETAADIIGRTPGWLNDASNQHRAASGKAGQLTYAEARAMTRAGATALAEDLALLCGGVLLPPIPITAPIPIHKALADTIRSHGETISDIIQRAADGEIDLADAKATMAKAQEGMRAYATVISLLQTVLDTGESLK